MRLQVVLQVAVIGRIIDGVTGVVTGGVTGGDYRWSYGCVLLSLAFSLTHQ